MSAPAPTARARLDALFAKIEAFFAAAQAREGEAITCRAGCADCCRRRFTVTGLEAEVIREGLAALPDARRDELALRAREGDSEVCAALDADGRCAIYAHRPVICRTHGLPIRFTESAPAAPCRCSTPARRTSSARISPTVSPASVMDQTTLSTILGALDAADAAETGAAPAASAWPSPI